jgi:hypothetical protein
MVMRSIIVNLIEEIKKESQEIATDSYSMSIGELVSLYKEGEINIRPEFQRYFRWTSSQKTRLIESILLGIPVPPIFVQQNSDGKWELIDGLQRVSTFLELMGELKDGKGNKKGPFVLTKTKHLPSLQGCSWINRQDSKKELPEEVRIKIKRARIDVNIVLEKIDNATVKYELFQRLNTGGSLATEQEIRNCLLSMTNNKFYLWILSLKDNDDFITSTNLSERLIEEQYDVELLCRFFVLKRIELSELSQIDDLSSFLDDKIISLAQDPLFDLSLEKDVFAEVFSKLNAALTENAFKKYDTKKQKAVGSFLISVFEIMALGLGYHYDKINAISNEDIVQAHQSIFSGKSSISTGMRASSRLSKTVKTGRALF